jgi:DNA-binding ferritin-like protein
MEPSNQPNKDLLLQLLAIFRAIHWSHWTAHWQVKGTPSYGDHLMFQRLYEGMVDEIDSLGEKIVSYYGAESVASTANIAIAHDFLSAYDSRGVHDPYQRALQMELHLQRALSHVYETVKESGEMSLGLDDFLMGLANAHETAVFLLRQRLRHSGE